MADPKRVAVIGGSGLYLMDDFSDSREVSVATPFGPTSDVLTIGRMGDLEVVFLPRHGRGHRHLPSEVPYRANIWAIKSLGVERIFSVSAVGSMKEEITLGTPVLIDQFIDRTHLRASTFFGDGVVAHVSMADPICGAMRGLLADCARRLGIEVHAGGTYLCMEGPQFSSRGESLSYRQIGVDVIGMTNATEAKLAREAEICYATLAIPTDYDCWHQSEEAVSVEAVIQRLVSGTTKARAVIVEALKSLSAIGPCGCHGALAGAIMTARDRMPAATLERLAPIVKKYV